MTGASSDVGEVMSTARTIRRFTDEPVEDVTLARCLEAARWAPSGLTYGATYEVHDRAGEFISVLFAQRHYPTACELLLGGSIFPPCRTFCWPRASRAWGMHDQPGFLRGEQLLREAIGVPEDWLVAGHIVVGWPAGQHGAPRRRPLAEFVTLDHWDRAVPASSTPSQTGASPGATAPHRYVIRRNRD